MERAAEYQPERHAAKAGLFARALYFGEALLVEVNGQMLVAQSFQRAEHATAPDEFSASSCAETRP